MTDITADVSLVGALEIETDVRGVRGESAYAIAVRNGFVGTEEEWLASLKGSPGDPGQDGHSPVITATKSNGTTTVKVDGVTVATINDGEDGHSPVISASKSGKITTITADGTVIATINDGQDGQDGHSPVITTSKSGKTTTILSDGTSIGTILDGEDGQDGVTPSFSIGRVQSGQSAAASITGTDANPVLNLTLPKGDDGQAGQGIPTGGTQGQVLKKSSATDYDAEWSDESGAVTDVQVNGTSILNNGIADIPKATSNSLGVVRAGAGLFQSSTGEMTISKASDSDIKTATGSYKPIVPSNQDKSVFYGLAKASGDTTQSQSFNAVGVYTDSAKVAIQKMLGIYEAPWELIREDTFTNETGANHIISVDGNGDAFELTDAIIFFETPTQSTDSAKGSYGQMQFIHNNNYPVTVECGSWTQAANTPSHGCAAILERKSNLLIIATALRNATSSNGMSQQIRYGYGLISGINGIYPNPLYPNDYTVTEINILTVTGTGHYRLYGKRKWN